jgi:hypothetical protein
MPGAETTLFYDLWSDHNKRWRWCFSHSGVSPEVRLCVVSGGLPLMPLQIKIFHLVDWLLVRRWRGGEGVGVDTQTFFLLVQQECKCVLEWSTRVHNSKSDTWRHLVLQGSVRSADVNTDAFPSNSSYHTVLNKFLCIYLFRHSQFETNVTNAPIIFRQQKAAIWEHATAGTDQGRSWNWKLSLKELHDKKHPQLHCNFAHCRFISDYHHSIKKKLVWGIRKLNGKFW